jgi:glucose-1-phosphate thymidylyltransferase
MARRGIILAGGSGTRLHPLTEVISKQLLPVFDKPMIYYPLSAMMLSGVREILIITTPHDQTQFRGLLGDGSQWGVSLEFAVQPSPDGLAQAFLIGADFIRGHHSCLFLGDNILYGHGLQQSLQAAAARTEGASVFGYYVEDPERYGVIEFGADRRVLSIEEKPAHPRSNWAAIGVYFYDRNVLDYARSLKPSRRGELEITDLNNIYLKNNELHIECLGRGFAWFDAGTHESLLEAGEFVRVLQTRQGQLLSSPEEIAYRSGWIDAEALLCAAQKYGKTKYGARLAEQLNTKF